MTPAPAVGLPRAGATRGTLSLATSILSSLKFAVGIALALAVACVLGTILPQDPNPEVFRDKFGPSGVKWISFFGLHDVFHTWWFTTLMVLWNMSLIVCTGKKFVGAWPWAYRLTPKDPDTKRRRGHMWGNWVFHVSLVTICLGAFWGQTSGWKEFLKIPEGETVSIPHTPLQMKCEKFQIQYYPGTQQPKQFLSDLALYQGSEPVATRKIWVNKPWDFDRMRIYQASYGTDLVFRVRVTDPKTRHANTVNLREGEETALFGDLHARALEFFPDFKVVGEGAERHIENASDEIRNPALHLALSRDGQPIFEDWLFFHPKLAAFSGQHHDLIRYQWEDIPKQNWTGLQVVHDPGVPVIWAGVGGLMVGLFLMFYLFPRNAPRLA